jgi:hypothetical protein
MSDTTSDTSAIDNKKQEEESSSNSATFASNIVSFITSVISIFIVILLYFSGSGLILFVCKLAQSNVLPTEENCYPYTDSKPNIQSIQTNVFTTFTDPEMSMKMEFPYDLNLSNKVLDMFREYKNKPNSNFLANYFISIFEQLLHFNYSAINTIMNLMNSTFPEQVIIGLGPIIAGFLYSFGIFINTIYFIYLWFSNMGWFFKTNKNDSGDGKPQWEDVSITSPVNWCLGVGIAIIFVFLLIFGFAFISVIPLIFYHKAILTTLFYKAIMNGKQISSFTIVKETLKYYKLIVVSIISLFVILLAFSKLGVVPGIFSIITICLIYWGILAIDLFKPINETNLTPSVGYDQATKKCVYTKSKGDKHGFLYNLLVGQSGGSISKELKKINKNLSSN